MNTYKVIVGNLGTVHTGNNLKVAQKEFNDYKRLSEKGYGRVAFEPVWLIKNCEPFKSFYPISARLD